MQHTEIYPVDTAKVKQLIETGEYYSLARSWYDELYHRMLGERSFFIIVTLFAAVTSFFALVVYSSMFPLNPAIPYVIKTEKITDDVPYITPLREKPAEDLSLAVARFLVKNYVITRERYQYDVTDLERRFARIKSTTGDAEFAQYMEEVNPENPASPYNKYGRDRQRSVGIQKVTMQMEQEPKLAKVYFYTTLAKGPEEQTNQWLATISFRFPPLTVDQETNKVMQWDEEKKAFSPMQNVAFEVVEYAVQEVGNLPR